MIDRAKKILRKKAINNVNEKIAYLQKKPSDYTKDELRDLIIKEEKKIIKGLGWKSAGTTILLMLLMLPCQQKILIHTGLQSR